MKNSGLGSYFQPKHIDTVVPVPALVKDGSGRTAGYGFPTRFKLESFDANDHAQMLLDATDTDFANPGAYPILDFQENRTRKMEQNLDRKRDLPPGWGISRQKGEAANRHSASCCGWGKNSYDQGLRFAADCLRGAR